MPHTVEQRTHRVDRRRTVRRKASTPCKVMCLAIALAGFAAFAYYPTWKVDSCAAVSGAK